MLLIQILIAAFALFAVARALKQFHAGRVPMGWLLFWILFWVAAATAAIMPRTTEFAASLLGVGRGADLVIYLSLIALFYLVFRLFVKIEDQEHEMTRLVRMMALKEAEEDQE